MPNPNQKLAVKSALGCEKIIRAIAMSSMNNPAAAGPGRLNKKKSLTSLGAKIAARTAAVIRRCFVEYTNRDALSAFHTNKTITVATT